MTAENILKLIEAGYTKEEISAMDMQPAEEPKPAEDPKPAEEPKPAEDPKPTEEPADNSALAAVQQELTETRQQLNNLIKQMQQNNLKTASVQTIPDKDLEKKTDEAMAELIRPTIKGEN